MARTTVGRLAMLAPSLPALAFLPPGVAWADNYIPPVATLANLSGGKVCAIGSSKGDPSAKPVVPAYYLAADGKGRGVWQKITSATGAIAALDVGTDIKSVATTPSGVLTLKSAAIRFFVIATPTTVKCADISYTIDNPDTGDLKVTYYPYPKALFEMTAWVNDKDNVLTIDTSNVDSFEMPIQMTVTKGTQTLALIGNPITANAARTTLITGPDGSGGTKSPLVTWLRAQKGSGAPNFTNLALSSSSSSPEHYDVALLQSPKDYLFATCVQNGKNYVPPTCSLNNALLHWSDPLNSYFDAALTQYFTGAYADPKKPLMVMGDAVAPIPQAVWTVTGNTANCPVYQKPDGHSLQFTLQGWSFVLCNPLGQLVTMDGKPVGYDKSTSRLELTPAQYAAANGRYIGWNLGQPETGFIGTVTGYTQAAGKSYVTLDVLIPNGEPNLDYSIWAFSNLKYGLGLNVFETPSEMVFANDGAFAAWPVKYVTDANLQKVALSIARNMIAAFSRGVALCNNVAMAGTPPPYCQGMTKVTINADKTSADPQATSDAIWANEANWYPAGGLQDYYAQYIHTAQIDAKGAIVTALPCAGPCANISLVPNNQIPNGFAKTLQGVPMGMGYAFGYDENPTYVKDPAQVSSKLDPIPSSFGTGLSLTVTIGRSTATP